MQIEKRTGGSVPKRQVKELTVRAAQDFDAFYANRLFEPENTDDRNSSRPNYLLSSPTGLAAAPQRFAAAQGGNTLNCSGAQGLLCLEN